MLKIIIPATPPSVNHYIKHRVGTMNGKPTVLSYHSAEAKAWWVAVDAAAGGRSIQGNAFEVAYVVYQGHNERGDVDNYGKVVLDGLAKACVIDTDHKVVAMHAYKSRDREFPRTEVFIREAGQMSLLEPPMPDVSAW